MTDTSLPAQGVTTNGIVAQFSLNFSEDLFAVAVSNSANYELRSAGADGVFGTGDDVLYTVALNVNGYTSGLSAG